MSEVMDGGKEAGLRILLQLALDEMLNVVEAVDHQHDTRENHMKYSTPFGAINGARKVREDILAQCAMWGIEVSPHRKPGDLLSRAEAAEARLTNADQEAQALMRQQLALQEEIDRLRKELRVALGALDVFAAYAEMWHPTEPSTTVVVEALDDIEAGDIELTLGDFRRAAQALGRGDGSK